MPDDFNWKICNLNTANALLSGSNEPGKVWKFDPQFLPPTILQGMSKRGPVEFYVSGALVPQTMQEGVTALGEMGAVRYENNEAIPYRWIFAVSGSGEAREVVFGAFHKDFEPRHFISGSMPTEVIFTDSHPEWPNP